jgi:hypothetical protein
MAYRPPIAAPIGDYARVRKDAIDLGIETAIGTSA